MPKRRFAGLLGLLVLGTSAAARAQAPAATNPGESRAVAAGAPDAGASARRQLYTAAHDSLLRRVRGVYAQAEARTGYFTASQGSFGGLHRRAKSFSGVAGPRVQREVVKRKFGIELEKVVYFDAAGHKVLAERYEGHQLTRLELWEYPVNLTRLNRPAAKWLLVRGDYLRHECWPAPHHTVTSYYQRRPPGEPL